MINRSVESTEEIVAVQKEKDTKERKETKKDRSKMKRRINK